MADKPILWTCRDLSEAVQGEAGPEFVSDVTGISIDTRTLEPGDAFFAIRGDNSDGHDYIDKAFENGASVVVVEKNRGDLAKGGPVVRVGDVLGALERLGCAARDRSSARIIAITGSVGKTGSKEALRQALAGSGEVHASAASYNNHWGVPLSLSRLPESARFGIFEVGMNHPGEITPLTRMIRPHIAIITTVQAVHLSYFKSVDEIAEAKAEIFDGLESGGAAILNQDNEYFGFLSEKATLAGATDIVGFGSGGNAGACCESVSLRGDCSIVKADILGDRLTYRIGAPGAHLVSNSLAVLAAVKLAGGDLAIGALALADWSPPKGRGARKIFALGDGEITLIDESYNANPSSMAAALTTLAQVEPGPGGRRIAVLGDMLELGEESTALHIALVEKIKKSRIDLVYTAGPLMKSLYNALPASYRGVHAEDSTSLAKEIPRIIRRGDLVMVKGSLGSRMIEIVAGIEAYIAEIAP